MTNSKWLKSNQKWQKMSKNPTEIDQKQSLTTASKIEKNNQKLIVNQKLLEMSKMAEF